MPKSSIPHGRTLCGHVYKPNPIKDIQKTLSQAEATEQMSFVEEQRAKAMQSGQREFSQDNRGTLIVKIVASTVLMSIFKAAQILFQM